ncbi:MAG: lactate/malate family dehydrogenase, partial [Vicinamibacterales bacterium]
MSRVVIIGAGDLGGAAAQALASRDRVGRVSMIDAAAEAASGKALDIQQSGAVDGFHARLVATDDLTTATGATVCVVADRFGPPASEWQGEEGLAMMGRLVPFLSGAPIIFAGAQQAGLMLRASREAGVERRRLIGSAPE